MNNASHPPSKGDYSQHGGPSFAGSHQNYMFEQQGEENPSSGCQQFQRPPPPFPSRTRRQLQYPDPSGYLEGTSDCQAQQLSSAENHLGSGNLQNQVSSPEQPWGRSRGAQGARGREKAPTSARGGKRGQSKPKNLPNGAQHPRLSADFSAGPFFYPCGGSHPAAFPQSNRLHPPTQGAPGSQKQLKQLSKNIADFKDDLYSELAAFEGRLRVLLQQPSQPQATCAQQTDNPHQSGHSLAFEQEHLDPRILDEDEGDYLDSNMVMG